MPSLAELNRRRREYAYSGRANVGDVPYLYEIFAQQAAANQPAGIGNQGGPMAEENAAPNPQSLPVGGGGGGGGGASGGADTGLPGPGQLGFGDEVDQMYRDYAAGREGGQAGEDFSGGFYGEGGYVDPTLAELVGYLGPGPIGFVGSLGAAGMRGYNAGLLDEASTGAGGSGLSGWQQLGAALGLNDYGDMGYADTYDALSAAAAGRAAGTGGLGESAGSWADAVLDLGPRDTPASSWAGGLEEGAAATDTAYGGGAAASTGARSGYRSDEPGRRGARDRSGGGGAEGRGGGGGGGGFGCFVAGTPVLMADGSEKPIEEISPGDMVAAFAGLGALEPRRVVHLMHYQDREPLTVRFAGGAVRVTAEHPFLVPSGEFVRAADLAQGGYVVNASGDGVEVISVDQPTERADVFNFEVEDLHTYVAGGLRVHNIKHDGGVISEDRVPGQYRGDVPEVLQEGEGVLTADAVALFGPSFVHSANAMARMMKHRGMDKREILGNPQAMWSGSDLKPVAGQYVDSPHTPKNRMAAMMRGRR